MKSLEELNNQLTHPIQIDLKRPLQKAYPHLRGIADRFHLIPGVVGEKFVCRFLPVLTNNSSSY